MAVRVLRYHWVVDMIQHYDAQEVHGRLRALLAVVEVAEVETFNLKHRTPSGPPRRSAPERSRRAMFHCELSRVSAGRLLHIFV